jgi:hypothetical protein
MKAPQSKADLEILISDKVEESLHLDYKDARSLQPDGKRNPKTEIAKDVTAMANSAGGIIIYGMKEYDEQGKAHFPEKITPIDRTRFSREWLEQVINSNISPKIEGLQIHPVLLDQANEVVYVVEIPQSATAHQNTADGRYYRRYNFMSEWMVDYEIRDIQNRAKHPTIELDIEIEKRTYEVSDRLGLMRSPPAFNQQPEKKYATSWSCRLYPKNVGSVYALYINFLVQIPEDTIDPNEAKDLKKLGAGIVQFNGDNTHRDVVDMRGDPLTGYYPRYGPSRFDPILPGLKGSPEILTLRNNPILDGRELTWTVYADNATPRKGKVRLDEIPIIERDERTQQ